MSPLLRKKRKVILMKQKPEVDERFVKLMRSALTAIDGLWFLEVEEKIGFDEAFEIDIAVWKRYGPIIIKRIKKALSITKTDLDSFLQVLEYLCSIDGTKFDIKDKSPKKAFIRVTHCPWWENLKRSNRENLVRCDVVDKVIFPEWAKSFNPKIEFLLEKSLPDGHDACEWVISYG